MQQTVAGQSGSSLGPSGCAKSDLSEQGFGSPPGPKAQRRERLCCVVHAWGAADDEDGAGSAPEAVLQHPRELAVAVGHVPSRGPPGLVFSQGVDHVGQAAERLVDLGALCEGHAGSARLALPLAACEECRRVDVQARRGAEEDMGQHQEPHRTLPQSPSLHATTSRSAPLHTHRRGPPCTACPAARCLPGGWSSQQ